MNRLNRDGREKKCQLITKVELRKQSSFIQTTLLFESAVDEPDIINESELVKKKYDAYGLEIAEIMEIQKVAEFVEYKNFREIGVHQTFHRFFYLPANDKDIYYKCSIRFF